MQMSWEVSWPASRRSLSAAAAAEKEDDGDDNNDATAFDATASKSACFLRCGISFSFAARTDAMFCRAAHIA